MLLPAIPIFVRELTRHFPFVKLAAHMFIHFCQNFVDSKATGPDNISAKLLKECPDLICESLSLIFNNSLRTGIFPNEWKNARVTLIDSSKSTPKVLKCDVPQGTILGQLLFLLYINDLPQCLDFSHPRMYADDTSITYAGKDVKEINDFLSKDLKSINTWLSANKLKLEPD